MRNILLSGICCFASLTASAKEVTFFFDVHSSGPEIYPCDAGLWQGHQNQFCHYKGTATTCNPAQGGWLPTDAVFAKDAVDINGLPVLGPNAAAHACICTGVDGGSYLMNFVRYKASIWDPTHTQIPTISSVSNPNHEGWSPTFTHTMYGTEAGATVARDIRSKHNITPDRADNVPQELATQLEAVTFNLSTELYGAHFFVDMCFRGPQIPFYLGLSATGGVNPQNANSNWSTKGYLTATNPFLVNGVGSASTRNYVDMANLKGRYQMVCDLQGKGTYKFDHNGIGNYYNGDGGAFDTTITDIVDSGFVPYPPLGTGTDPSYHNGVAWPVASTNWVGELTSSDMSTFTGWLNLGLNTQNWLFGATNSNWVHLTGGAEAPRFCKLRYYFMEKPAGRERAWQRADSRFIVKWAVEESEIVAEDTEQ